MVGIGQGRISCMRRILGVFLLLSWFLSVAFAASGALVVVGGGGTGPEIVARALELSGGKSAIVAVLPQSSALPDAGDSSVKMWLEAGAARGGEGLVHRARRRRETAAGDADLDAGRRSEPVHEGDRGHRARRRHPRASSRRRDGRRHECRRRGAGRGDVHRRRRPQVDHRRRDRHRQGPRRLARGAHRPALSPSASATTG